MTLIDDVLKESEKNKNEKQKLPFEIMDSVREFKNIDSDKIKKRLDDHYDYIKKEKYYELFKTGAMQEPKSIHMLKREFFDEYGNMPSDELLTCYKYYNELKEKAIREINHEKNTLLPDSFNKALASKIGLHSSTTDAVQHPIQNIERSKNNSTSNIMEHYKQMEREILKELIKDPQAIRYVDRKTAPMYEYVLRKDCRLISEVNTKDTKEVYKTMKMIEANVDNYSNEELTHSGNALGDLKNILNKQYGNKELLIDKRLKALMQKIEGIIGDFVRQGRVLDPE